MTRFDTLKGNRGITLIELIVAMAIILLAIGAGYALLIFGTRVFNFGSTQYDIQSNTRFASQFITEETRYAAEIELLDLADMDAGYRSDYTTIPVYENYLYYDNASGSIFKLNKFTSVSKMIGPGGNLNFWSESSDKILRYQIDAVDGSRNYTIENEVNSLNLDLGLSTIIDTSDLDNVSNGGVVLKYITLSDYMSGSQAPTVLIGDLNDLQNIELDCSKAISAARITDQGTAQATRNGSISVPDAFTTRVTFTRDVQNNRQLNLEIDFYEFDGTVSTYAYTIKYTNQDLWTVTSVIS